MTSMEKPQILEHGEKILEKLEQLYRLLTDNKGNDETLEKTTDYAPSSDLT